MAFFGGAPNRSQLALQLLNKRQPQPIQSVEEGITRTGSRLLEAALLKRAQNEQQEQAEELQATLAEALNGNPEALASVTSQRPELGTALLQIRSRETENALNRALQGERLDLDREKVNAARVEADQKAAERETSKIAQKAETQRKILDTKFDNVSSLRKEASSLTSGFRKQKAAIQRIRDVSFDSAGELKQSPAASLALVFNFMKVLDPGSVVRESEFATVRRARTAITRLEESGVRVPAQVQEWLQSIEGDGFLIPEQIRDINDQADAIFDGARRVALDDISPVLAQAEANNFELERVFPKSILEDLTEGVPARNTRTRRRFNPETGRIE